MQQLFTGIVYLMFFLSGAAALMYQVVWVRSLSLIFGGSHLAVTVVLSIFMAGLAIGSYFIGKYVDRAKKTLKLYGMLEIGIAVFAMIFVWLVEVYPSIYVHLVQGRDDSHLYITFVRIIFSVCALIIPTTLMGGTLPVLVKFISRQPGKIRDSLSFLYGFNTLGAVIGASAAGFFLLRMYSVSTTLKIAVAMNICIGIASILLQDKVESVLAYEQSGAASGNKKTEGAGVYKKGSEAEEKNLLSIRLVLFGTGVSGFCALGYEILWTRILSMVAGASVYSFTTMLVAFLTGIALGSEAFGLLPKIFRLKNKGIGRSILWFGIIQIIIGVSALIVTVYIRELPQNSIRLQNYFGDMGDNMFKVRLWVNFTLAYAYMLIPAFFMGAAFPLAGKVYAEHKDRIGQAVGEVMAYNTIGAILGAAVSGFLLIYLFGIERSLQMLITINIGFGLFVIASTRNVRLLNWATAGLTAVVLIFLAVNNNALRMWDMKFFAVYRNNQPDAFRTPQIIKEAVENTDVLYYAEGTEATISSIKVKGGAQALSINGKIVASTLMEGQQCQLTLGHLPMLLHKDPKKVLVIGLGTGMTLGATSVHPGVEEITLVEIEPKVVGGARTFKDYNHNVLDDPKLKIVFNDGRNFLLTTEEKYDVITADPIHPWAQGASYLYTVEYFKMASERLRPGGIMCQWLPVYELSTEDIKSVVKTFSKNFKYTMLWLTYHDAELIGSNSPIVIDEEELEKRIGSGEIYKDLKKVFMGSATDFLSYFVAGTDELKAFSSDGILNTDDNLYLEFSSPFSIATLTMADNINAILEHMNEGILPYLLRPEDKGMRAAQELKWNNNQKAARVSISAQTLLVGNLYDTREFHLLMSVLEKSYSSFAPGRYLKVEYMKEVARIPRVLEQRTLVFLNKEGGRFPVEITALFVPFAGERSKVAFVDNAARIIYGQTFFPGQYLDESAKLHAGDVMAFIGDLYRKEQAAALSNGKDFPPLEATIRKIKEAVMQKTK